MASGSVTSFDPETLGIVDALTFHPDGRDQLTFPALASPVMCGSTPYLSASIFAMKKAPETRISTRIAFLLIGIGLLLAGVGSIMHGGLGYRNAWGGVVFAPFAIFIGLGLLFVAFSPSRLLVHDAKKRSRVRGWPK